MISTKNTKKQEMIYDKLWDIYFISKEEQERFYRELEQAEENIKNGKVMSQKEMEEYIAKEFGIYL